MENIETALDVLEVLGHLVEEVFPHGHLHKLIPNKEEDTWTTYDLKNRVTGGGRRDDNK